MNNLILTLLLALPMTFLSGCQTAPKNVAAINPSANVQSEIATTRRDIDLEKTNHLALLSPEKFKKAESNLEDAEQSLQKNRSSAETLKHLAISRAWLEQAREIAQRTRPMMEKTITARENAVQIAEANTKEVDAADKDFRHITERIEEGKSVNDRKISELTEDYLKAEKIRTRRARLTPIEERIKLAKDMKAKKLAPDTYERAVLDYEAARKTFEINPYDRSQVLGRISTADESSKKLVDVATETKAAAKKTPEQIVLEERARIQAEQLKTEKMGNKYENSLQGTAQARLENERLQSEAKKLEKKAEPQVVLESLRHQIPENQADIMMSPNGTIMLRLKDLQFKPGSSELSAQAGNVLNNVKSALADVNAKKLIVEGHTDSTGSDNKNKEISESRAQSVATYLQSDDQLKNVDVEATGVGSERPLKNNKTKQGRAENRRVEITVQTL